MEKNDEKIIFNKLKRIKGHNIKLIWEWDTHAQRWWWILLMGVKFWIAAVAVSRR